MVPAGDAHGLSNYEAQATSHLTASHFYELWRFGGEIRPGHCRNVCPYNRAANIDGVEPGLGWLGRH